MFWTKCIPAGVIITYTCNFLTFVGSKHQIVNVIWVAIKCLPTRKEKYFYLRADCSTNVLNRPANGKMCVKIKLSFWQKVKEVFIDNWISLKYLIHVYIHTVGEKTSPLFLVVSTEVSLMLLLDRDKWITLELFIIFSTCKFWR